MGQIVERIDDFFPGVLERYFALTETNNVIDNHAKVKIRGEIIFDFTNKLAPNLTLTLEPDHRN